MVSAFAWIQLYNCPKGSLVELFCIPVYIAVQSVSLPWSYIIYLVNVTQDTASFFSFMTAIGILINTVCVYYLGKYVVRVLSTK